MPQVTPGLPPPQTSTHLHELGLSYLALLDKLTIQVEKKRESTWNPPTEGWEQLISLFWARGSSRVIACIKAGLFGDAVDHMSNLEGDPCGLLSGLLKRRLTFAVGLFSGIGLCVSFSRTE